MRVHCFSFFFFSFLAFGNRNRKSTEQKITSVSPRKRKGNKKWRRAPSVRDHSREGGVKLFYRSINLRLGRLRLLNRMGRRFLLLPFPGPLVLLKLSHHAWRVGEPKNAGKRAARRVLRVEDTLAEPRRLLGGGCESHGGSRIAVGVVAVPMPHESTSVPRLVPRHLVFRRVVPDNNHIFILASFFSFLFFLEIKGGAKDFSKQNFVLARTNFCFERLFKIKFLLAKTNFEWTMKEDRDDAISSFSLWIIISLEFQSNRCNLTI